MRTLRFLCLSIGVLLSFSLYAQRQISGNIFDTSTDLPISGAVITIKSNGTTTTTNADGRFELTIPQGSKSVLLEIKATGFAATTYAIGALNKHNIGLKEQSSLSVEKVITIGSRNQSRTEDAAPVAVDIIPVSKALSQTGFIELNQILHFAMPSFNANRQTGADLADHVTPTSMRGLGPDQVLILVNGKRLRPSSVINIFGVRGRGNAGYDLNTIPASSVERIEVLRDGAAAQYGLDAVAGVINIVLKGNQIGTTANLSYGTHMTGWGRSLNYEDEGKIMPFRTDGGEMNANITHGFQMGKGNLTLMGDYFTKGFTYRPNNTDVFSDEDFRSKAGDPSVKSGSLYLNGNYPLKKGELYLIGGLNKRNTISNIWNIPFDDTTRNVYDIFDEPYFPQLLTDFLNMTGTAGYKTKWGQWGFDLSNTYGATDIETSTIQTLNPSLGKKSPTEFFNSHQHYYQNSLDMDINRAYKQFNLALGVGYRHEKYQTLRGDEASWKTYDNTPFELTDPTTGDKYWATKAGTSQGFPGLRPEQEVDAKRNNISAYADMEYDVSKNIILAGATRFEHYSDFGSTFGGKIAARVKLSDKISVRGSIQTGFRAPSLTQLYFQSTINDIDGEGNNFEKIVANNRSELAQNAQIPALKAEQSRNIGAGFAFSPNKSLTFSVDAYDIKVKDRIVMSGAFFDDDDAIGAALQDAHVTAAQFFLNALDTKTKGLDINASYKKELDKGSLNISLAGNFNKMSQDKVHVPALLKGKEEKVLSPRESNFILNAAPQSKFHAVIDYQLKKLGIVARLSYFSSVNLIATQGILGYDEDLDALYNSNKAEWLELVGENYKPRFVPDLMVNYDLTKKFRLTVGGNNILDVYPTIQASGVTDGGAMWDGVQMGMGGAFFFGKLSVKL